MSSRAATLLREIGKLVLELADELAVRDHEEAAPPPPAAAPRAPRREVVRRAPRPPTELEQKRADEALKRAGYVLARGEKSG